MLASSKSLCKVNFKKLRQEINHLVSGNQHIESNHLINSYRARRCILDEIATRFFTTKIKHDNNNIEPKFKVDTELIRFASAFNVAIYPHEVTAMLREKGVKMYRIENNNVYFGIKLLEN